MDQHCNNPTFGTEELTPWSPVCDTASNSAYHLDVFYPYDPLFDALNSMQFPPTDEPSLEALGFSSPLLSHQSEVSFELGHSEPAMDITIDDTLDFDNKVAISFDEISARSIVDVGAGHYDPEQYPKNTVCPDFLRQSLDIARLDAVMRSRCRRERERVPAGRVRLVAQPKKRLASKNRGKVTEILQRDIAKREKATLNKRGSRNTATGCFVLTYRDITISKARFEPSRVNAAIKKFGIKPEMELYTDIYCIVVDEHDMIIGIMYKNQKINTIFEGDKTAVEKAIEFYKYDRVTVFHLIKQHVIKTNDTPRSKSIIRIYGRPGDEQTVWASAENLLRKKAPGFRKICIPEEIKTTIESLTEKTEKRGNFDSNEGCLCERRESCDSLSNFRKTHTCEGTAKLKACANLTRAQRIAWMYDGSCCSLAESELEHLIPASKGSACICSKVSGGGYDMYGKEDRFALLSSVVFDADKKDLKIFFYDKELPRLTLASPTDMVDASTPKTSRMCTATMSSKHTAKKRRSDTPKLSSAQVHSTVRSIMPDIDSIGNVPSIRYPHGMPLNDDRLPIRNKRSVDLRYSPAHFCALSH